MKTMESLPNQKKLEDILVKESHIIFKERVSNVWQNIKKNKWIYIGSGLALVGAGVAFYLGCEAYKLDKLIEPIEYMPDYLVGVKSSLEFCENIGKFSSNLMQEVIGLYHRSIHLEEMLNRTFFTIRNLDAFLKGFKGILDHLTLDVNLNVKDILAQTDFMGPVKNAVEQVLQNYNTPDIQELVKLVDQTSEALKNQDLSEIYQKIDFLKESITHVAELDDNLGIPAGLLGVADVAAWGVLSYNYFNNRGKYRWVDNLSHKRIRKDLKKKLPEIKKVLSENPNLPLIYDVITALQNVENKGSPLLETIDAIKDYSDTRYKPIFEAIAFHPEKYTTISEIREAFDNFESSLNTGDSELYTSLLKRGWSPSKLHDIISEIGQIENKKEFLNNLSKHNIDETLASGILSFYNTFDKIPPEKRITIANYLFKKGNKQLASQLASCKIDNQLIMRYLSSIDEIPNIGVKGQVKSIVKLNKTIKSLEELGLNVILTDLIGLLTYERREFDENLISVVKFLERHPNVSADQVFGSLEEYYSLTKGGKFKSDWIKKEEKKRGQQSNSQGWTLDKKGERKVMEELEMKVNLARYKMFHEAIDNLYYAPLSEILGGKASNLDKILGLRVEEKKADIRKVKMTQELANVILGYNHMSNRRELHPLLRSLRNLLAVYLTNPDEAPKYLSNLAGNKDLEKKIKPSILESWREGLSKAYNLKMKETKKRELQKQVEKDWKEFMKCVKRLGYKFDKEGQRIGEEDYPLAKAEKIFKEVSKYDLPEEKTHLLEMAKNYLSDMKQKGGIVRKESGTIRFYDAKDPIESMQMGVVTGSCTNIVSGSYSFASIVNAIDDNKKVIYMADETNLKVGRTLALLTDMGIVTYRNYKNTSLDTDEAWVDFFHTYSKKIGIPLIVPSVYATKELKNILLSKGAKKVQVEPILYKAVCSDWYDDAGRGIVGVSNKGYKKEKMKAYVLN